MISDIYLKKILKYILFNQPEGKKEQFGAIIESIEISKISTDDYGEYVYFNNHSENIEDEPYFIADIEDEVKNDGAVFVFYCFKEVTFLEITSCVGYYSRNFIENMLDGKKLGTELD